MPITIDMTVTTAKATRMAFLMTHYRAPCEMGPDKIAQAMKTLRRLFMACTPTHDGPPTEIIEAVANDLNTPAAIAIMHGYRKAGQGKKLFAALRFLGFFDDLCLPDEIKTLPDDHPFQRDHIGPVHAGIAQ